MARATRSAIVPFPDAVGPSIVMTGTASIMPHLSETCEQSNGPTRPRLLLSLADETGDRNAHSDVPQPDQDRYLCVRALRCGVRHRLPADRQRVDCRRHRAYR